MMDNIYTAIKSGFQLCQMYRMICTEEIIHVLWIVTKRRQHLQMLHVVLKMVLVG